MQTTLLSKKGFRELQKEIQRLENEVKQTTGQIRELGRVKSRDDKLWRSELSSRLEITESKLIQKRQTLKNAKPLPRKRDRLYVAIGSVVDLVDQQGRLFRYTLVDSLEANPSDGRISIESPLGKILLNRQKSEAVTWHNGQKIRQLQLVNIS